MKNSEPRPTDIDAYLATVPDDARAALEKLRWIIKAVALGAVEVISYGMPAFKYQSKPLVYFAAAKKTPRSLRHLSGHHPFPAKRAVA